MTTDSANLVFKDLVVESRLELSLSRRGTGDIHGGLTTSEDDKVLLGCNGGTVKRGISGVGLENLEVLGGDELYQVSIWSCRSSDMSDVPWTSCPCRR